MTTPQNNLLQQIIRAKENYRKVARAQTWEEKVEAIGRMRVADQMAKEGMRKTMAVRKSTA
jgi:hypothetical protein